MKLTVCVAALVFATAISPVSGDALAQTYPSKPIRYIVPFSAGGANDILARILGARLSERWKVPVVIDNRAGAGGNVAAEIAARTPADGYNIFNVSAAHAINMTLYSKLPYHVVRDFAPVSQTVALTIVLVVNPTVPAKSISELIALARTRQLLFGSGGTGTAPHLAYEIFKALANFDATHVPYKGAAPATTDVIAGQIDFMMTNVVELLPHVRAGKLRALGVSSTSRDPLMPDVPTMQEAGVAGYDVTNWIGVLAPAGTPNVIVSRLSAELVAILKQPDIRDRLTAQGFNIVGSTPDEFAAFIKAEVPKWAGAIKRSGAKVE